MTKWFWRQSCDKDYVIKTWNTNSVPPHCESFNHTSLQKRSFCWNDEDDNVLTLDSSSFTMPRKTSRSGWQTFWQHKHKQGLFVYKGRVNAWKIIVSWGTCADTLASRASISDKCEGMLIGACIVFSEPSNSWQTNRKQTALLEVQRPDPSTKNHENSSLLHCS